MNFNHLIDKLLVILFITTLSRGLKKYRTNISKQYIISNNYQQIFNTQINNMKSEQELIFYPQPHEIKVDLQNENISEDELLYKLFMSQILELTSKPETSFSENPMTFNRIAKQKVISNDLTESATILEVDVPIEFFNKNRVCFGNFVGRKMNSNALLVRLPSFEIITIDSSQVIAVWDTIADDIPITVNDWSDIVAEALEILGNMSPRKSDLSEFWRIVSKRSRKIPVDSLDLGIYIFQERNFKAWINPRLEASECNVYALTAAQRYVAALLLSSDEFHFKRKVSSFHDSFSLVEGGYIALDEGVVLFKEGEVFEMYVHECARSEVINEIQDKPFRASCITKYLRSLETYALSPSNLPASAFVKHILKKFDKSINPSGAKDLLKDMKKNILSVNNKDSDLFYSSSSLIKSVTPWSEDVIDATLKLTEEIENKRIQLRDVVSSTKITKVVSMNGIRMDYRCDTEHPMICIDNKYASFFDDCFSFNPNTNEILIHVVDVMETLRKFEILQRVAKERVSSIFLPSGPLHMLPPPVLEALKLSSHSPNEVITVAVKLDFDTGEILGTRVFPSLIGPVFAIDLETADELLDESFNCADDIPKSRYLGYPKKVVSDLLEIRNVMLKVIKKQVWVDQYFSQINKRNFELDKKLGTYQQIQLEKTMANRLLNSLLTIYSNSTVNYCLDRNIPIPIPWVNRDRTNTQLIRRFGTQPLRNYVSQIQQKQLRSALKMEVSSLNTKDCAMIVAYHNNKQRELSTMVSKRLDIMSFESLENYCQTYMKSSNYAGEIILSAQGIGRGGVVNLLDFKVQGVVNQNIDKGQIVKVKVIKILSDQKSVSLQLI